MSPNGVTSSANNRDSLPLTGSLAVVEFPWSMQAYNPVVH
jgi:hypothetical protein